MMTDEQKDAMMQAFLGVIEILKRWGDDESMLMAGSLYVLSGAMMGSRLPYLSAILENFAEAEIAAHNREIATRIPGVE